MNARWLIFDYIDTSLPLRKTERRAINQYAKRIAVHSKRTWTWAALVLLIALGVWFVVWWQSPRWFMNIFVIPISLGFGYLAGVILGAMTHRRYVYRAMVRLGYEVCGDCGYWLRDLPESANCPECGAERELMLQTEPDAASNPP